MVRTRQYITKFIEMRSHLQGTALKLQTVKSHQAMAEAMGSTAQAMHKMNKVVNVASITKMMAEFEKENARTEMTQEIMGDAIDDVMADENTEEEEERIVGQVLDEIGISMGEEIPDAVGLGSLSAPVSSTPDKVPAAAGAVGGGGGAGSDSALSDLEARLNNLKR